MSEPKKIVSIEELRAAAEARRGRNGQDHPAGPAADAELAADANVAADVAADVAAGAAGTDTDATLTPKEIQELADALREELGDEPGVRLDKVIEAKMRISLGYYTGERITRGLIDSLSGKDPEGGHPHPLPAEESGGGHEG